MHKGIAKGLVPICPREVICSRSLKTCVVAELAVDSECGGGGGGAATAVAGSSSGGGGGGGGGALQLEAQFGKEDGEFFGPGDTYTLISNLGLTSTVCEHGLFEPFVYKHVIVLPRQARDKHGESAQKEGDHVFLQALTTLIMFQLKYAFYWCKYLLRIRFEYL